MKKAAGFDGSFASSDSDTCSGPNFAVVAEQTVEAVCRRRMRRSATSKTLGVFGCCLSGKRPSRAFSTDGETGCDGEGDRLAMNAATPSRNHTQARLVAFACCLAVAWLSADHRQAMAADAASDSDLKWTPHRQSRSEPPVPMSMAARPSQAPAPAPAQPIDAVAPAPAAAPRPAQPAARSPVASVVA